MKVCWLWADNVTTASKILKLTNSEHVFASVRIYSSLGNSVTHPLMVDAECQCFAKNETVHVRSCSISYNLAQVINNAKMFFDSMSNCQVVNMATWFAQTETNLLLLLLLRELPHLYLLWTLFVVPMLYYSFLCIPPETVSFAEEARSFSKPGKCIRSISCRLWKILTRALQFEIRTFFAIWSRHRLYNVCRR